MTEEKQSMMSKTSPYRCTIISFIISLLGTVITFPIILGLALMSTISELLMSKYANEESAFNGTFYIFIGLLLLFVVLSLKSKTKNSFIGLSSLVFIFMHVVFFMDTIDIDTYFHGDGQTILGYFSSIPKVILFMGLLGAVKDLLNARVKRQTLEE